MERITMWKDLLYKLCTRKKTQKAEATSSDDDVVLGIPTSGSSSGQKSVVVKQPVVESELKLKDLMKSPAEVLSTGKYGSLYKAKMDNCNGGKTVVVKRIKDLLPFSGHDFKQKMKSLRHVKHPYVLSPLAFYYHRQEKLLVYEFQENGSLFKLLQGKSKGFDWSSRLGIAAMIAEGLTFMHQEVGEKLGIAHGNLKSSNIWLSSDMEARISEYGLMDMDDDQLSSSSSTTTSPSGSEPPNALKDDVYGFGVILLELLTGKLGNIDGIDLAEWVQSVVREEWTGEVFDKELIISDSSNEERLVNLLQVAIKCVHRSPEARPSMNQVALMINTIREEEENSWVYVV